MTEQTTGQALEALEATGQQLAAFDGGATLTDTGLVLADDLPQDRALEIGVGLGIAGRASSWWIGDFGNECVRLYGENEGLAIVMASGYDDFTLKAWMDTARDVPAAERSTVLSFSTHIEMRELCVKAPEKFRELRHELEVHKHRTGKNRGHKDVRAVVAKLLADAGYQLTLADFPTTAEELADLRSTMNATQAEIAELRLETGRDKVCPKCGVQRPTEEFKKPAPSAAHEDVLVEADS